MKSLKIQRGNQNPYIEEEQTTQWPKEKVQKDKQRSTKHIHKTKDRVTRTPLKTGDELRCSEKVSSSCSTSDTRRVNLVTTPVISHEWRKDREVFTTSGGDSKTWNGFREYHRNFQKFSWRHSMLNWHMVNKQYTLHMNINSIEWVSDCCLTQKE